jgi:hypothetical protein
MLEGSEAFTVTYYHKRYLPCLRNRGFQGGRRELSDTVGFLV